MKTSRPLIVFVLMLGMIFSGIQGAIAQEQEVSDVYDDGTVWNITYVRTHANMSDVYLVDLSKTWANAMEKYEEAGLIESYKILSGQSANEDDFNLMLMIEFKSFAMFDPNPEREARFDEIEKNLQEEMGDEYQKVIKNYGNIRDILGSKTMRELKLK